MLFRSPRYFARVPGPSSFPAILGDWIGTGLQSISSSWVGGSGPATVELTVLSWMRDAVGLSPSCDGILQSGGSIANLSGLIVAREQRGVGAVYLSDQVHASVLRGLRAMGWPSDLIRTLHRSIRTLDRSVRNLDQFVGNPHQWYPSVGKAWCKNKMNTSIGI